MATSWKPVILVLSIGEKWMQDLCDDRRNFNGSLNELLKHAVLIPARTAADALKYLSKNFPEGILVTDPGLAQPGNKELLDAVVAFARASGTVVMSYCFSSHLRMDVMKDFWKNAWGLPWEPGSILRGSFALNTSASTLRGKVALLHELYRQQALSLVNVEREHTWYLPMDNSTHRFGRTLTRASERGGCGLCACWHGSCRLHGGFEYGDGNTPGCDANV
jgi:hypothetical protein